MTSKLLLVFLIIASEFFLICYAGQSSISFLSFGDFGGQGSSPYYTPAQLNVAKGMNSISAIINSDFIVSLGDNFYSNGVTSVTDSRFDSTWGNVYIYNNQTNLMVPWNIIAGEHDYNGNITAQLAYSKQSVFWNYPDIFYVEHYKSLDNTVTLDVIMIDTIDLAGSQGNMVADIESKANTQLQWIENQLASSNASYLLVAGHYDIYSIGQNGPNSILLSNLKPLLETYNAHYLSAHDHNLQYFKEPSSDVRYWVIGTGSECCYSPKNIQNSNIPPNTLQFYVAADNNVNKISGGFASFVLTPNQMSVTFHDQDGNNLYGPISVSPRNLSSGCLGSPYLYVTLHDKVKNVLKYSRDGCLLSSEVLKSGFPINSNTEFRSIITGKYKNEDALYVADAYTSASGLYVYGSCDANGQRSYLATVVTEAENPGAIHTYGIGIDYNGNIYGTFQHTDNVLRFYKDSFDPIPKVSSYNDSSYPDGTYYQFGLPGKHKSSEQGVRCIVNIGNTMWISNEDVGIVIADIESGMTIMTLPYLGAIGLHYNDEIGSVFVGIKATVGIIYQIDVNTKEILQSYVYPKMAHPTGITTYNNILYAGEQTFNSILSWDITSGQLISIVVENLSDDIEQIELSFC